MNRTDRCGTGAIRLRPLRMPDDMPLVHGWVSGEHARYWGLVGRSVAEVEAAYREILRPPGSRAFIGLCAGEPAFLVERYDPADDPIGTYYEVRRGDVGMHILVAPPERRTPGHTWQVFSAVMDFLFADDSVERIVVEPDIRNDKIHRLNRRAGFVYQRVVQLPRKTAYLAFCTRAQYEAALARGEAIADPGPAHLTPGIWSTVNARLLRKMIGEYAHELLLRPRLEQSEGEWGHYVLATDRPDVEYRFRAQLLALEHWRIDPTSIEKFAGGGRAPLDALGFLLEVSAAIGMSGQVLPSYLEELTSTLCGAAYKHANQRLSAAELASADFQSIESGMTEGHPAFVANNGRIGFAIADHARYAPEAAADVHLVWLAGHRSRASFAGAGSQGDLLRAELGAPVVAAFEETLRRRGLDPAAYLFLPVHPWQWDNKLAILFAPDIASDHLVLLGRGEDAYRAQQSIRTFFNTSHPERHYVKTALSILNMGFVRGLSPGYMETTPAINDWVHALLESDPYLRESGFGILREVASVAYRHAYYEAAVPGPSPYKKMFAALWRESPVPRIRPGQRLMTMAALLHRDRDGEALLPALVRASGVGLDEWLRRYLRAYLAPLLHCFYAHDLVFMPHGENLILVLDGGVPVRVFMKDIAEEVGILDPDRALPDKVRRIAISVPEEVKTLSIFTDVFDGVFRHLVEILVEQCGTSEERFWRLVAGCVLDYQRSRPDLADRFERLDLFARDFRRSCLNRLQIANNQQMVDLASPDPASCLQFAGTLENPIARFRLRSR
jgi:siderophore synthetase component/RimJ/RimL family protein N-acetyltransferase